MTSKKRNDETIVRWEQRTFEEEINENKPFWCAEDGKICGTCDDIKCKHNPKYNENMHTIN